jgi:hypothetical protein
MTGRESDEAVGRRSFDAIARRHHTPFFSAPGEWDNDSPAIPKDAPNFITRYEPRKAVRVSKSMSARSGHAPIVTGFLMPENRSEPGLSPPLMRFPATDYPLDFTKSLNFLSARGDFMRQVG